MGSSTDVESLSLDNQNKHGEKVVEEMALSSVGAAGEI